VFRLTGNSFRAKIEMSVELIRSTIRVLLTAPAGEIDDGIRDRLREAVEKPGLDDIQGVLEECCKKRLASPIVLRTLLTMLIQIQELRRTEQRLRPRPRHHRGRTPRLLH
jgi:hypothetical protein